MAAAPTTKKTAAAAMRDGCVHASTTGASEITVPITENAL